MSERRSIGACVSLTGLRKTWPCSIVRSRRTQLMIPPGPLHAFFVRIRARRGHQIAAVAVARKLTVLCWHLLTKGEDYQWARPAMVANKTRAMQLQVGHPQQKGSRRGPAYAYNVKALRDREMMVAAQAERSYERSVVQWKPRRPKEARGAPQFGRTQMRRPGDICSRRATLRYEVAVQRLLHAAANHAVEVALDPLIVNRDDIAQSTRCIVGHRGFLLLT
jgi:hypothetical protein